MPLSPRWLFVGAAIVVGACADPADRSTDWNYLHATIIEPNCATTGCHSAVAKNGGPFEKDGVDLSSPHAACCGLAFQPGVECDGPSGTWALDDGAGTYGLMLLLRGEPYDLRYDFSDGEPVEYDQMPIDVPLAPAEIELIERWVTEGAPCE